MGEATGMSFKKEPTRPPPDLLLYEDFQTNTNSFDISPVYLHHRLLAPTSSVCRLVYHLSQSLTYSTVLDHSSQVWWRWANIFFTLALWALELMVSSGDDDIGEKWKVE